MRFRNLRVAWSVLWGIVAVLLLALWLRSYETWDRLFWTSTNHGWQLNSMLGHVTLIIAERPKQPMPFYDARKPIEDIRFNWNAFGFYIERLPAALRLGIPFWLVLLSAVATATAAWWRRSFSLRTLLAITTLVAVVLGSIIWSIRG